MSAYADKIAMEVLEADMRAGSRGVEHPPLEWHKAVALARAVSCKPATEWDHVERRKDNWTLIVKEYESKIGRKYKDHQGKVYVFFGLVHSDDDYYYGLIPEGGRLVLSSCVGSLEGAYDPLLPQKSEG